MLGCKSLTVLPLALALATSARAAPGEEAEKKELIKKDLEKMQGEWVLVDNEKPKAKEKSADKKAEPAAKMDRNRK